MTIQAVIPLFPQFTALDGIGPYEVLQRIPDVDVTFIGHERGVVRSDNGMLGIEIDGVFEDFPRPDIVVFPGGQGTRALMDDDRVLDWVRSVHETTRFTTSVCTGSLVLAAAGLLDGLTATTHWGALDVLTNYGAVPTGERVVEHLDRRIITAAGLLDELTATTHWGALDVLTNYGAVPTGERVVEHLVRRIITAAGVSSGIDMALRLVELLYDRVAAEACQLMIEYDPQPPFDAGATHKVGEEVVARVIEYAQVRV
ncbi:MAG: DJ-1/PfpI family protein [Ilumatobacteraceae bacterium]